MKKHEHSGHAARIFKDPIGILRKAGLANGKHIFVDIGAGSGYLSFAAGELLGVNSKIYAIDNNSENIDTIQFEVTRSRYINIKPLKADAAVKIPVERDSADFVLMSNVLHGFVANGELDRVMKNINNILKDEGKLIIIEFAKVDKGFGPPMEIRLGPPEAEDAVAPYGYEHVEAFDIEETHYAAVYRKVSLQDKFC